MKCFADKALSRGSLVQPAKPITHPNFHTKSSFFVQLNHYISQNTDQKGWKSAWPSIVLALIMAAVSLAAPNHSSASIMVPEFDPTLIQSHPERSSDGFGQAKHNEVARSDFFSKKPSQPRSTQKNNFELLTHGSSMSGLTKKNPDSTSSATTRIARSMLPVHLSSELRLRNWNWLPDAPVFELLKVPLDI